MNTLRNGIIIALIWLAGCILFYLGLRSIANRPIARGTDVVYQIDTLIRYDTIHIDRFREVQTIKTDTLLVVLRDTTTIRDTTFVVLQREVKQYQDSLFSAQISGFEPSLDWIEIYTQEQNTREIYKPKPTKWSLGLQAGYGASTQGLTPYIGVGVSYNLWSF